MGPMARPLAEGPPKAPIRKFCGSSAGSGAFGAGSGAFGAGSGAFGAESIANVFATRMSIGYTKTLVVATISYSHA